MHELGRYLQRKIDEKGWNAAELARRAGLSRQTVYNLITDNREYMDQTPQRKTVSAIADALGVTSMEILTVSARALGIPMESLPPENSLRSASNEQILTELASRLSRSKGQDDDTYAHKAGTNTQATLRAVASTSNPRPGQKSDADEYGITEIHGDATKAYPVPPIESLAAHPKTKTTRELLDEETSERDIDQDGDN